MRQAGDGDRALAPATQRSPEVGITRRLAARVAATRKAEKAGENATVSKTHQIAFFRLSGEIPETSEDLSLFTGRQHTTMQKWLRKIAKARNDANVDSIVLDLGQIDAGWAQIEELCDAIHRVRKADKPVYGFITDGDLKNYTLASACSQVVIAPAGHLIIPGLHLQLWFYKDLMDKLGITADILHIGAYKGAGQPYTRSSPTPELQAEYTGLTDDLYHQILKQIADARDMKQPQVAKCIDTALFNPNEAIRAGLVDICMQLDDLFSALEFQQKATVNEDYGKKTQEVPDLENPFAFFKIFAQMVNPQAGSSKAVKPVVGLILMEGLIVDKRNDGAFETGVIAPADVRKAVDAALDDDNVKAVVLRIDSPGGSALASDIMYSYIRELAKKKPLIVSMGNVAASGGYYVASASPTIMADPATITGSIGVLGGKVIISGLLDKIGIKTWSVKRGEMAGVFDMTTGFTPPEREKVFTLMKDIYGLFLSRVLETRHAKLTKPIEKIAGGRVYTGRQALDLGLVDHLGGLTEAIYLAAGKANITDYDIRVIPKPKNFLESLMEDMFSDADVQADVISSYAGALLPHGNDRASRQIRSIVTHAVMRIRLLQTQSILTVLPFDTNLLP